MTPEQKKWIDEASYEDLLRKWRFAPAGDPMFQGDTGEYYSKVMNEQRSAESWWACSRQQVNRLVKGVL